MKAFKLATLSIAVALGLAATSASAAVLDFEAPAYTTGDLVGQDGWTINSYAGTVGSSLTVSTNAPLAGSQGILYDQSVGSQVNDVSRSSLATITRNGTSAPDYTASALLRVNRNDFAAGQVGLFFGTDTVNGFSPVNVLLNQVNSDTDSGFYEVAFGGSFQVVGSYIADHTVRVTFNVDLDSSTYTLFAQDLTAGTPAAQLGAAFPFFGGPAAIAPSYNIGVGTLLRAGTGRIDDISITPTAPVPEPLALGTLAMAGTVGLIRRRRPA